MPPFQRLDKILSSTGAIRRSEVTGAIRSGRVTVDGTPARSGAQKADPEKAAITLDGRPILWSAHHYYMLHKPAGVICSTDDPRERTVLDLLPDNLRALGLFPAGRLDKETTGLVLLTSDGALAHALLSPRRHVEKIYTALLDTPACGEDIAAFGRGMTLGDGTRCLPAKLEICGGEAKKVRVTVTEGKYHLVRRMFAARGHHVLELHRLSVGPLLLDEGLPPGSFRALTGDEIQRLGAPAPEK